MRFPIAALLVTLAAVPGGAAGQEAAPSESAQAPTMEELARAVRTAHRGDRTDALTAFWAALSLRPTRTDEESVQVNLDARFLAPTSGRPLLRYQVEEVSEVLERGWDDRGPWARVGDQIVNLSGREWEQEREQVRQQIGLAGQLLGFLDPASLLESLEVVGAPRRQTLQLGKQISIPCDLVVGTVDRFPMFSPPPGTTEPSCMLQLWFDARNHQLTAVQATPLDAEEQEVGIADFLFLRDYAQQQGVSFPSVVVVFRGFPDEPGRSEATVKIRAIDLEPDDVTRATMRRPTR